MSRGAVVVAFVGLAIAVNGCGGSSGHGGTGGAGGAIGAGGSSGGGAGAGASAGTTAGPGGGGATGTAGGGAGGTGGVAACGVVVGGTDSGATCNVVAAAGPCVTGTFTTAAAPAPAGGAFAAGTYNLVSQTFYAPADGGGVFVPGQPFRQTYVLSDVTSTSFTLDQASTTGTVTARSHETAAVSGMTATFTQTWPAPDAGIDWGGASEFTASSSSITLFWSRIDGIVEVRTYDKAP
jgi:hypothetical protein